MQEQKEYLNSPEALSMLASVIVDNSNVTTTTINSTNEGLRGVSSKSQETSSKDEGLRGGSTNLKDPIKTNKRVYHGIINQVQEKWKFQERINEIKKILNTSEEMKKKQ